MPFALIASVLAAAAAVAAVTPVKVTADGRGVIRPDGGNLVVRAPQAGRVGEVRVGVGRRIEVGDTLVEVAGKRVPSEIAGAVERVDTRLGDVVAEGAPLLTIAPAGPFVGLMALPASARAKLHEGMIVSLDLDELPAKEDGAAIATILHVGSELVSKAEAEALFGRSDAVREPSFLATLRLDRAPRAAGGGFQNGMLFTGTITLEERRAISLLLPPRRGP
jgi:hypothetical protein